MQRLYSHLIGLPIVVRKQPIKLGRVLDLIIDPDGGQLVALITMRRRVIAPIDIAPFEHDLWQVKAPDVEINPEELVRLHTIPKKRRKLIAKSVVTKSGSKLGHVADYVLEMETLSLKQLFVVKGFLWWGKEKRLIDFKNIEKITENEVIVKDRCASEPTTVKQKSPAFT